MYVTRSNSVQPYGKETETPHTHRIEIVQRSAARYVQKDNHYTKCHKHAQRVKLVYFRTKQKSCYTKYITNKLLLIIVISRAGSIRKKPDMIRIAICTRQYAIRMDDTIQRETFGDIKKLD